MKTYFRLFAFASPVEKFAVPFFITSVLGIIFGLLNFTLLIPVFELLFDQSGKTETRALTSAPSFDYSLSYFKNLFYVSFGGLVSSNPEIQISTSLKELSTL
jgi:subfamily B ATP-binding cassette protein MsbA